eukprot:s2901_g3.t3
MEKLTSALRSVAPELVISTLFVFVSVDAAVSANHCLEGCHAHGGGLSRRLMGTPCPPPTFSVQVSLATGFAAAVASSFTYKPKDGKQKCKRVLNTGLHTSVAIFAQTSGSPTLCFNARGTLALALRGKLRPLRATELILAQLFASVLAAALVMAVVGLQCLRQDFDMMTQEMSPPASRILLQAILNLLIILVALWSMSVPIFVGFSYIAASLVGLQQLGFDLPNILRSFGLLVIGVRNWACVWTTMLGSLSGVIIAVVLERCHIALITLRLTILFLTTACMDRKTRRLQTWSTVTRAPKDVVPQLPQPRSVEDDDEVPALLKQRVQIRTQEMHRQAEYGSCGHWEYKAGGRQVGMTDAAANAGAELFAGIDADGNGRIDARELERALRRVGVEASQEQVHDMLEVFDSDQDGSVDFKDFWKALVTTWFPLVSGTHLPRKDAFASLDEIHRRLRERRAEKCV